MHVLTRENEKYKGDALLQKVYTVDFLTKQKKENESEVPQYYVENNHQAIISPSVFEEVQHQEKLDGPLTAFYEDDWYSLVDYATVYSREDIRFTFKNGMEIKA